MSPDLEPNLPPRTVSCHFAEGHQPPEPHQSGPFHPNLKQENQFFTFPALEVFKTSTVYLFQYNSKDDSINITSKSEKGPLLSLIFF